MKAVVGCGLVTAALGSKSDVPPVQKVVQLMEKMLEKGKEERQTEQVQYAAHRQFCESTTVEKHRAMAEAEETSASLKASIEKYSVDAALLTKEICNIDKDIANWTSDMKRATNVRQVEKADHDATHKSYTETSDALQKAATVLKEAAYDRELRDAESSLARAATHVRDIKIGHESARKLGDALPRAVAVLNKAALDRKHREPMLVRVMNKIIPDDRKHKEASWGKVMETLIPDAARRAIDMFLQQGEYESEDLGSIWNKLVKQGQHHAEFHSHDVIELLQSLSDKFVDERTSIEKDETNSQHSYDMLMQDMKAQISQATLDRGQKVETKAKKVQAKADATADWKDTETALQADQKYISHLVTTCEKTASAFHSSQQLRDDEIDAIQSAIKIISSTAVAGNAQKHGVGSLSTAPSFAQLRSHAVPAAKQDRVVKYLEAQAKSLGSPILASTAAHLSKDPFPKAQKMLKDLVQRLQDQADEEADHHGWCTTELAANEHTRKQKTNEVDMLHAEVDQLQASISKASEHIAELAEAVRELESATAEATRLRAPDKAKNAETLADAQEAQKAVSQAVKLLNEVYSKSAPKLVFAQKPSAASSGYKGMRSETDGVVDMLQVISSDFARLESETKSAEVAAQNAYLEFMTDSQTDKAQKSADIKRSTSKKEEEAKVLIKKSKELESVQKDLDSALAYYSKLKPSCIESGLSYDDRRTRRKDEIKSVQVALSILTGDDVAK